MPRWLQILLQVAATAAGAYGSYKMGTPLPLVISGGTNAVIGGIAQSYNTDGTPQSVPFVAGGTNPPTKPTINGTAS